MQGEYTRLPVRNERYDRPGRNRATNRRVMKPTWASHIHTTLA